MKFFLLNLLFLISISRLNAQIGYTETSIAGAFTQNAAPTNIVAASVDDGISASTAIGFTFQYGCINYTTFQASSNGVMFLGTVAAGSNLTNNLNTSADRPAIAPLWDDLATGAAGNVNYKLTGVSPNRILTIEWLNMEWSFSATNPVISFQVKLYETSNRIDFVYRQEPAAIVPNGASVGLGGQMSGDFYSLNGLGAGPFASKLIETTTLSGKPATGQIYRWDPILCSGLPVAGTAAASPSLACAAFNTTLSLSGSTSACGLTYQWQSGPTVGGPWTNIIGATAVTSSVTVSATTYYRCVLACGASTAASVPATASLAVVGGGCGICGGVTSITLPYAITGTTTCGAGNDITAANAVACGNSSYLGGEDVVYSFTPAISGQVSVTFSTSGSAVGITYWQGCPISGGICKNQQQGLSSFGGNYTFCMNVTAGVAVYLVVDSWPGPTCNGYNLSISAPINNAVGCALSTYVPSGIGYSFDAFVGTTVANTDDILFNNVAMLGFPFCYTGASYWGGYIASNGAFVLDAVPCNPNVYFSQYAAPGIGTGWSITAPAPSLVSGTSSTPQNAILAPWQDIDPSLGGTIRYGTLGVAPNRRFVVSWENIPMFSCGTSSPSTYYTGQVKLFETSNNIEIHVGQKRVCPGWGNGQAILGLTNFNGTIYIPPVNATAHNAVAAPGPYNQWIMTNTAYRFSSPCASTGGPCVTLPINFKNFYGQQIESINKLTWETALEENVAEFIVERSTDAINFNEIGRALPYNQPSTYSFNDVTFKPGIINYYRITALEKDGNKKSTFTIPIGGNYENINVSEIYPNPIADNFSLTYNAKVESEIDVRINDMFGRVVKVSHHSISAGNTQTTINCTGLNSGIYIVEVVDLNSGKVISQQKLIVVN
jgi:hypothetical protein